VCVRVRVRVRVQRQILSDHDCWHFGLSHVEFWGVRTSSVAERTASVAGEGMAEVWARERWSVLEARDPVFGGPKDRIARFPSTVRRYKGFRYSLRSRLYAGLGQHLPLSRQL